MRLYGKGRLPELLEDTAAENRLPHAILLSGDRGSGRRTMAKFIAKLFLCGPQPCEVCPTCTRINADAHPDVIYVRREVGGKYALTKSNGVTDIRIFMESTAVKPNDGDIKIYIFENADEMSPMVQNTLLKNIEEPESWVKYIFLCENSSSLLTTIRSRVTEFRVPDCTPEQCFECLVNEYGVDRKKAEEYSQMMSGNIGKCLEALGAEGTEKKRGAKKSAEDDQEEDQYPQELRLMDSARYAAAGIAKRNGYMLCTALGEQTGRKEYSGMLEYLAGIIRDALAFRTGGELYSCGKAEARAVAGAFDETALTAMLDAVFEVNSQTSAANINLGLCSAYLTSRLL